MNKKIIIICLAMGATFGIMENYAKSASTATKPISAEQSTNQNKTLPTDAIKTDWDASDGFGCTTDADCVEKYGEVPEND